MAPLPGLCVCKENKLVLKLSVFFSFFLPPENHYKEKLQRRCCLDGLRDIPMPYSCTRRSFYITEGWDCIRAFRYCCSTYRYQEFNTQIPTTFPPTTAPPITTSTPSTPAPPRPTYPYSGSGQPNFPVGVMPYSRMNYGTGNYNNGFVVITDAF